MRSSFIFVFWKTFRIIFDFFVLYIRLENSISGICIRIFYPVLIRTDILIANSILKWLNKF